MKSLLSVLPILMPLSLAAAGSPSHFATLDGMRIHYESFGSGPEALVFIHGWTCDSTFWKLQAPIYESRRSLLIDLPGHGLSDKPKISYTMDLFARAVDAVLTDAKVNKATLIGHSMGTAVSAQFLRLHPEQVAGLVIADGFVPQPPKNESDRAKQLADAHQRAQTYSGPDSKTAATAMIGYMFTKDTPPALREEIQAKMLSTPPYVMASAMEGMATMEPVTETWPHLRTLAIMVKRPTSASYQAYLKTHFLLIDFREFDNSGHFVMMEQPAAFNEALQNFLTQRTAGNLVAGPGLQNFLAQ